jgi:hypothetical protein
MFINFLININLLIGFLSNSITEFTITRTKNSSYINQNNISPIISCNLNDFYYFEIKPKKENNLFNITFYSSNNNFSERYLNQKKPLIYLDSTISTINNKTMYITCYPECDYDLYYQVVYNPILYDNSNFSLYYKNITNEKTIYYITEVTDLNSNNILINVMGKSIENFPISFYYNNIKIL